MNHLSLDSNGGSVHRPGFADIHCHCLPGLDDGPATTADAVALCRALADDGVSTVVACAHQLGRFNGKNSAGCIRKAVAMLQRVLDAQGIPLTLLPGGDVRLDERIPDLLARDLVTTVGDGRRYLLIEPHREVFIDMLPLIEELSAGGVRAIISHPERNPLLMSHQRHVKRWVARGGLLQLTAGSFLGDFGSNVEAAAWHWLRTGPGHLVATDAHDAKARPPRMSKAMNRIAAAYGLTVARRVCVANPLAVVCGHDVLATEVENTPENGRGKHDFSERD